MILNLMMVCVVSLWMTGCAARESMTISKDAYVAQMASAVAVAWPSLARQPGMESETEFFSSAQILVYDGIQAWLVDSAGYKKIDSASVKALDLPYGYGAFDKVDWQDRPTVYMGLGEEIPSEEIERVTGASAGVPYLFLLATHEAFHFYGQKGWPVNTDADDSRATLYPAQIPPRQYRNQLIRNLIAASQGESDAFGKARYWYGRWKAEYPAEVRRIFFTDVSEGTAQYIETLAELMAEGYAQYSASWDRAVTERLSKNDKKTKISIDQESYTLGTLTGNLLDRLGTGWWRSAVQGANPLEILLSRFKAVPDAGDASLDMKIQEVLERRNQELQPVIGAFVDRVGDFGTLRLLVPMASLAGSIEVGEQYKVAGFADEIFVDYSARFATVRGSINVVGITTAITVVESCSNQLSSFLVLLFPEGELPAAIGGRLQMKKDGVDIDVPYPVKSSSDEKIWCALT